MSATDPPNPNNGWVNPRRPLTAMIDSSGGLAGGVEAPTQSTTLTESNADGAHPRYGALRRRRSPNPMSNKRGRLGESTSSPPIANLKCSAAHAPSGRFLHRHPPLPPLAPIRSKVLFFPSPQKKNPTAAGSPDFSSSCLVVVCHRCCLEGCIGPPDFSLKLIDLSLSFCCIARMCVCNVSLFYLKSL